ncbi:MAG TPA: hypothetical protein VGQ28_17685 [Thermoanaerobaculia bacterium]|jgi:hypothetical protein|nr:hypothetical protein [Thermoanaerobaculia bacterium]
MTRRDKRWLLVGLVQRKRSCEVSQAEAALAGWGFTPGRTKGHVQVWSYREVTLTLHRPHGQHMDPGAVASVIRAIERAAEIQDPEEEDAE